MKKLSTGSLQNLLNNWLVEKQILDLESSDPENREHQKSERQTVALCWPITGCAAWGQSLLLGPQSSQLYNNKVGVGDL